MAQEEKKNFLITFHPSTLENRTAKLQLEELFAALESFQAENRNTSLYFTKSNADTEGRLIGSMIDDFVAARPNRWSFVSLGQTRYLSMMRLVDVFYSIPFIFIVIFIWFILELVDS